MTTLGFCLVYLGFGYGVVAVGWFARSVVRPLPGAPATAAEVTVLGGGAVALGSLWVAWVEGFSPGSGFIVQSGWAALDPFSTYGMAVLFGCLAVLVVGRTRGGRDRELVIASLGTCLALLALGNMVIQATTTRGSHLRAGGYVALVASLVVLGASAVLAARGTVGEQ